MVVEEHQWGMLFKMTYETLSDKICVDEQLLHVHHVRQAIQRILERSIPWIEDGCREDFVEMMTQELGDDLM